MKKGFDRKVFDAKTFWGDLKFLVASRREIRAAMRNPDLGRDFMEKVMMVVTAVNGCRYCSWFHSGQAAASGMNEDEILNMFNLQYEISATPHEIPALDFAQHYAETDRHPDPEMVTGLDAFYGERTARHIMLFIRMIFFGNLSGNTFDAFLSRLRGEKAENSSLGFETLHFLISAPVMLPTKWVMDAQNRAKEKLAH